MAGAGPLGGSLPSASVATNTRVCPGWQCAEGHILSRANLWKRSYIDITGQAQRPAPTVVRKAG